MRYARLHSELDKYDINPRTDALDFDGNEDAFARHLLYAVDAYVEEQEDNNPSQLSDAAIDLLVDLVLYWTAHSKGDDLPRR